MQELRFVLIIVGGLAIAALLFHGLWTSKKEGKSKFGDKPLGRINVEHQDKKVAKEAKLASTDEVTRPDRREPDFGLTGHDIDPLIADYDLQDSGDATQQIVPKHDLDTAAPEPSVKLKADAISEESRIETSMVEPQPESITPAQTEAPEEEPEMQVIVLNVHCAGAEPFVGSKLFDSFQQNGLLYGELDIYHRHADLSGTGKVLFSVANMLQPGTLKHDDPAEFTTKGISFFMTLPCYGDAEQNFKLMLKTAQQIADDMGANVLDDARNLMTPNRLAEYRKQIQQFKLKQQ
ncbi:cell division protein ZipA [Vibrio sp. V31_P5A7T61]|uniref:cell division protein ZipA n=1 Tax=unclassified Vibrio TaxID=2614977 RepID=UPI0013730499|nr:MULTISPECIES: cell division protein ZipA [unclassified Vibrio]NAW61827.1 cell division protein ZipA [Vibrio sp. V31_P5A7T61]NAX01764.1 cell division protein ZipA [Vibrio sp. V34_P3A8T189]NAX08666.1 cell division protein ZipA [Vibrio sp. V40_P2S30T141]NAX64440.1 cell division protein ZipA [Vibrio sp. V32_P6A28T40]